MPTLDELGLSADSPSEVVLTTFSSSGKPHASAVGVRKAGEEKIVFRLFSDTRAFRNLSHTEAGVVNIVSDAKLIAKQGVPEIFSEEKPPEFESSKDVNAPRLSGAGAFVEFEVENMAKGVVSDEIGTSKTAEVVASAENIEAGDYSPRPFRRSEFFLIESAILGTRAIEAQRRGREGVAKNMISEIERYQEECGRIAPGSPETELISRILDYLKRRGET